MSAVNIKQQPPTLFQRLARLRATVERARDELDQLCEGMQVPNAKEWDPTDDLLNQLTEASTNLDEAIIQLAPIAEHVDQEVQS